MRAVDTMKVAVGAANAVVTGLAEDVVGFGNYDRLRIDIITTISSGTDTGAVTLLQTTDNGTAGSKALGFSKHYVNATIPGDTLTEVDTTSDTFLAGGAAASQHYVIEVKAEDLDVTNDFAFVRCNIANITNGLATIIYTLYNAAHGGNYATLPTALS